MRSIIRTVFESSTSRIFLRGIVSLTLCGFWKGSSRAADQAGRDLCDFGERFRLVQEGVGSEAPRLGLDLTRAVRGQQDDPRAWRLRAHRCDQVEPLGAVRAREAQVEDRDGIRVLVEQRLRLRDFPRAIDGETLRREVLA